jgi:hypothetical protein
MKRHWLFRVLKFVLFAALFIGVFSFVVMSLWNWLMPALFGWRLVSYWQAVGILVLSKILFGGFRGRPVRLDEFVEDILQDVLGVNGVSDAPADEVAQPGVLSINLLRDSLVLLLHQPVFSQRPIHLLL